MSGCAGLWGRSYTSYTAGQNRGLAVTVLLADAVQALLCAMLLATGR